MHEFGTWKISWRQEMLGLLDPNQTIQTVRNRKK